MPFYHNHWRYHKPSRISRLDTVVKPANMLADLTSHKSTALHVSNLCAAHADFGIS